MMLRCFDRTCFTLQTICMMNEQLKLSILIGDVLISSGYVDQRQYTLELDRIDFLSVHNALLILSLWMDPNVLYPSFSFYTFN